MSIRAVLGFLGLDVELKLHVNDDEEFRSVVWVNEPVCRPVCLMASWCNGTKVTVGSETNFLRKSSQVINWWASHFLLFCRRLADASVLVETTEHSLNKLFA